MSSRPRGARGVVRCADRLGIGHAAPIDIECVASPWGAPGCERSGATEWAMPGQHGGPHSPQPLPRSWSAGGFATPMLLLLVLLPLLACRAERPRVAEPDGGTRFVLEPPPTQPAPVLAPIAGASVDAGRRIFAQSCARCHGEDGRGGGPLAAESHVAPTDLTRAGFLCTSTVGRPPVASDADLEAALERGVHRGRPELVRLDAAARRSAVLFVKTLNPAYAGTAQLELAFSEEPPNPPDDRARGRLLYLAFGCWRCHGVTGAGDGDLVRGLAWNGRPLGRLTPLGARAAFVCGAEPARLYQTLALGLGGAPMIMPKHGELAELFARPAGEDPSSWTGPLEGHASEDELVELRRFLATLPARKDVLALPARQRQARGAALLWSIVHYLGALPVIP